MFVPIVNNISLLSIVLQVLLFAFQILSVPLNFDNDGGDTTSLNPVILIPGLQGSQLMLLLQKDFSCHKATDYYFNVWLIKEYLLPFKINCLLEMLEIHKPSEQRVLAKPSSFGDTSAIENLDPNFKLFDSAIYMQRLVDTLSDNGFVRNVSIRGAPYDFRLAPNELRNNYFQQLDGLIYETFLINDGRKPALVCHSLGCLVILAYLSEKPQYWKDKYIDRLITVAAPFGGSMKALKAIAVGDNMGIIVYDKTKFIATERSFPSLAFLLPNPKVFGDSVILKTPGADYTANNFPEILKFLNASQTYENWKLTRTIIPDIPFPGVRMNCLYSIGEKTPSQLSYYNDNYRSAVKVETDNGDGTVNLPSLQYCRNWINYDPKYEVKVHTFKSINHFDLIRHKDSVNYITKLLTQL